MTNGPIEFLSDSEAHDSGVSEYGGRAGLVQPAEVDGVEAHSELTAGEKLGVMARAARVPVDVHAGNEKDEWFSFDPATGKQVMEDDSGDVTGVWGKEVGLSEDLAEKVRKPDKDTFPK